MFRYPWAEAVRAVAAAPRWKDGARRVRYVNPLTGGAVMTLLDCYLTQIDPGSETIPFRTGHTASMFAGVRPSISCASVPIASTPPRAVLKATVKQYRFHMTAGRRHRYFGIFRTCVRRSRPAREGPIYGLRPNITIQRTVVSQNQQKSFSETAPGPASGSQDEVTAGGA